MDIHYTPKFLMRSKDDSSLRIIDLWAFRSTKSNKRYIIEIEHYGHDFYGIKFYWKGVEKSKNRYSFLTGDYEPRTILMSCISVMLEYYQKNPLTSFGFVAAQDLEQDIKGKHIDKTQGNRRFQFYKRLMLTLFGDKVFLQTSDIAHRIYLLLNNRAIREGKLSIQWVAETVNEIFADNFKFEL